MNQFLGQGLCALGQVSKNKRGFHSYAIILIPFDNARFISMYHKETFFRVLLILFFAFLNGVTLKPVVFQEQNVSAMQKWKKCQCKCFVFCH